VFRDKAGAASANRGPRTARAKITVGVIGIIGVAAVAVGGWLLAGGPSGSLARPPATPPARQAVRLSPSPTPTPSPTKQAVPGTTVATVLRSATGYASPAGAPTGTVPASWYDRPSILPVLATQPGWVRVRLAQRPNGSTAWLPDSDVTLSSTPYLIVVNTATTHLSLYDNGKLVFSAPAGVGTPDDPTPLGQYFVAFDEQPPQPNPGYGPFIMVTSAHSEAISDWEGSGDAVIGIHGPLGMDTEIGTTGARISHGCIRLHEQDQLRLSKVPPGTPIDIIG
jgi:lipoprotein-anchoring transpeptidase ErfK/SrfK